MPLLRAVSRRATPNLTSSSKLGGEDEGGEAPGPGGMKRASSLLRGDSAGGDLATHRGILLKQKGTMLTWPKRFCWTEEGRFCWAEPSTKANKEHGKERGCIIVSEITAVDKVSEELVPAELPELDEESIMWLPEVLLKGENDLRQELSNGLNDWVRRLDNANHNRIHQGGPPSGSKPKPLGQDHRRASTVMEAQIEVEELRKLLSASEAKNAELERELAALKLAKTSNFLARHAKGGA